MRLLIALDSRAVAAERAGPATAIFRVLCGAKFHHKMVEMQFCYPSWVNIGGSSANTNEGISRGIIVVVPLHPKHSLFFLLIHSHPPKAVLQWETAYQTILILTAE